MAAAVSYDGTEMATGVMLSLTLNDQNDHWTTTERLGTETSGSGLDDEYRHLSLT